MRNWRRMLSKKDHSNPPTARPRAHRDGTILYNDDPLILLESDALDRQKFVDRLKHMLESVSRSSESSIVGLVGPWGSGKTTLLQALESNLAATNEWYIGRYNPWMYDSYELAITGFFAELSNALPKDTTQGNPRAALGKLAARIAPFGSLASIAGVDLSGALQAAATMISGDQSPETLKRRAEIELKQLEKPILLILDDIDRLEPHELLSTFRLVRLAGRLPNVYYLLSYDESTLEDVLYRTDLVGDKPGRARDYLEKMIQVRVDIPPLLEKQKSDLMSASLEYFLDKHKITLTNEEEARLRQMWRECLTYYLTQPRAVRRLVTQLDSSWREVSGEVDFIDFLGITFIRCFERSIFDLILSNRLELLGEHIAFALSRENLTTRWERWKEKVASAHPRDRSAIESLLAQLFLYLRSAKENVSYDSKFRASVTHRRGVGSAQFFDRYMQSGVPSDELPDAIIMEAIEEISNGRRGNAVEILDQKMRTNIFMVVARLDRHFSLGHMASEPWLQWLGLYYKEAVEQREFLTATDSWFQGCAQRILDDLGEPNVSPAIQKLCESDSGLLLIAETLRSLKEPSTAHAWPSIARPIVARSIEDAIQRNSKDPIPETNDQLIRLCFALKDISDPETVQQLLWKIIDDPNSPWTVGAILGTMVSIAHSYDNQGPLYSIGDFSTANVDVLLGLQKATARIKDYPTPAATRGEFDQTRTEPTLEERSNFASAALVRLASPNNQPSETDPEGS